MEKRTPQEVLKFARDQKARVLDLKFVDLPGTWQHFSLPIGSLEESSFEDGFGFDGSSIRGWKSIEASDMLAMPDPSTFEIVPWRGDDAPVARMFCDIRTLAGDPFDGDPRVVLRRNRSTQLTMRS